MCLDEGWVGRGQLPQQQAPVAALLLRKEPRADDVHACWPPHDACRSLKEEHGLSNSSPEVQDAVARLLQLKGELQALQEAAAAAAATAAAAAAGDSL